MITAKHLMLCAAAAVVVGGLTAVASASGLHTLARAKTCKPKPRMVCRGGYGENVNWSGKNVTGATIVNSQFENSKFIRTNFTAAKLINSDFSTGRRNDFTAANFTRAVLSGSTLCCKAPKAKFVRANLRTSSLPENMVSADFRQATLGEFSPGDDVSKADFVGVKIVGLRWTHLKALGANFSAVSFPAQMMIDNSNFSGANLSAAKFGLHADLDASNFTGAKMTGIDLRGASNMASANFTGANMTNADMTGANAAGANFTRANLTGAKLPLADGTTKWDHTTCPDGHVTVSTPC